MKLRWHFARYGRRSWAVYQGRKLLCVTVYKRGAKAVVQLLCSPTGGAR